MPARVEATEQEKFSGWAADDSHNGILTFFAFDSMPDMDSPAKCLNCDWVEAEYDQYQWRDCARHLKSEHPELWTMVMLNA